MDSSGIISSKLAFGLRYSKVAAFFFQHIGDITWSSRQKPPIFTFLENYATIRANWRKYGQFCKNACDSRKLNSVKLPSQLLNAESSCN